MAPMTDYQLHSFFVKASAPVNIILPEQYFSLCAFSYTQPFLKIISGQNAFAFNIKLISHRYLYHNALFQREHFRRLQMINNKPFEVKGFQSNKKRNVRHVYINSNKSIIRRIFQNKKIKASTDNALGICHLEYIFIP